MGGGGKGGSSDQSGMYAAMASAEAADKAYQLGEQQFQWSQQVWNQEQPLMNQSEQAQIALAQQQTAASQQAEAESTAQWQQYQQLYAPLEAQFVGQAQNWASPQQQALVRGQAMGAIASQGQGALNTAAEQLRSYGVNPSSPRYASLYSSAQPMLAASEAAAGTTASQNLKQQQLGLEASAINTGRGMVNAAQGLSTAGTSAAGTGAGAASGAGSTATSNIGSTAVGAGATSELFNAGANNMNSYVNAVNGYNQSQAEFSQAAASEMGGLGSAVGGLTGLGFMSYMKSDEREKTDIHREGTTRSGIPLYSFRYKEDPKSYPKVVGPMAQDIAKFAPHKVGAIPGSPKDTLMIGLQGGGSLADKYISRSGVPVAQAPRVAPSAASVANRYISPTGGPGVAPQPITSPSQVSEMPEHPMDMRAPQSMTDMDRIQGMSPQTQQFIMRSGGLPQAQARLSQTYPQGPPPDDHGAWKTIHSEIMPTATARPMFGPQAVTRPPAGLQGAEQQMMQGREGLPTGPIAERFGGAVRRYQDGGNVDPTLTPTQGGGQTGIPSQPIPPGGTPGGGVPPYASPSMGQQTDDVPAMLTSDEFVVPKDVAVWLGHKTLAGQIDKARKEQQAFSQRDDVGGEPTGATPQQPNFVSRPGMQQPAPGGMPPRQQGIASQYGGAIPSMPQFAFA